MGAEPQSTANEAERAAQQGTVSAGEAGAGNGAPGADVVIGEIPAAEEPTRLLWTARCGDPDHDLLGHYPTRDDAEQARREHLATAHGEAR